MPKDTNNLRNNFRANSEAQLYADLVRNRRFTLE